MRAIFFGMFGQFSSIPLMALIQSDVRVCAVVVPAAWSNTDNPIQALVPPTLDSRAFALAQRHPLPNIVQLAWEHGIPAFQISKPSAAMTLSAIVELEPDIAFVACFSSILPKEMLRVPRLGFYNLHPSLLPSFRGPEPLFWTFRQGVSSTGVTIHVMDEGIDSGDIVRQSTLTLPEGISGSEAERTCAELGGKLIKKVVDVIKSGELHPVPQKRGGWYYPSPQAEQFTIPASWPARRAYNFMRGTAQWGHPFTILTNEGPVELKSAIGFNAKARLRGPFARLGERIQVEFRPGVLEAEPV